MDKRFNLILFFILVLAPLPGFAMGNLSAVKSVLIGKPAPEIILPRTVGKPMKIVASRHGKKEVLIFWATWCSHCYDELGDLNQNLDSIQQKGIKVTLVDIGETREDVKSYFKKRNMRLTSFIDTENQMQDIYHLIGVPTVIFIDEGGIVRNVTHEFPLDYDQYFGQSY